MKSITKTMLVVGLLSFVSVIGCGQRSGSKRDARIRDLQSRNAKWEEDYRVVMAVNNKLRKRLAQNQSRYVELQEKIQQAAALRVERDELRAEVQSRIAERDEAQKQLIQFQKDLSGLVDRLQTATRSMRGATPTTEAASAAHLTATTNTEGD